RQSAIRQGWPNLTTKYAIKSRANTYWVIDMKRIIFVTLITMHALVAATQANAQSMREVVRKVDPAVVVVKTVEKNVLRAPQPIFVSSPGLGSGIFIGDGRILTAAHVVQAADKIDVEFG